MNKKYILPLAVVAIVVILAAWFNSYNPKAGAPSASVNEVATVVADANVSAGVVKEFTVTGNNFAFAPKTMTVKKGDTVKITFVNAGGNHDLRIDEFNATTKVIRGGAQETISFVADKTGSFEYYCSVGDHRVMGMKGTLIVE